MSAIIAMPIPITDIVIVIIVVIVVIIIIIIVAARRPAVAVSGSRPVSCRNVSPLDAL